MDIMSISPGVKLCATIYQERLFHPGDVEEHIFVITSIGLAFFVDDDD